MSSPGPARLKTPGEPTPRTAAINADATSSWCTSWNGRPVSGITATGSLRNTVGIDSTGISASGPATMQGRKT